MQRLANSMKLVIATAVIVLATSCAHAPVSGPVMTPNGAVLINDGGRGGLPVLFIHGNGADSSQWEQQLAHLRMTGRAVAIDLPGMGRSAPAANGDYSLEAMAAAVDAASSSIGLRRFVLVGHSYGGAVVATYAARHPEKVAAVIYADSAAAVPMTPQQMKQLTDALRSDRMRVVRAWFAPMLKSSTPAVQERVFSTVEKSTVDAFVGAISGLVGYDAKATVSAYHGPRFVIAAADIETPASFRAQFPDLPAVKIAGTGHWLMLDKPEEFNVALDNFVAGLR
jgi:pimeloyl-ACP methyl ester carboxylesterase